jgi:hypothetical protein
VLSKTVKIKIYKAMILPALLDECKLGLSNLGEVRRQRMLKNGCWAECLEATRGWRKFHNRELHNLCSSPYIIKMIALRRVKLAGHLAPMGKHRIHTEI